MRPHTRVKERGHLTLVLRITEGISARKTNENGASENAHEQLGIRYQ